MTSLPLVEFRRMAQAGAFRTIELISDWTDFWIRGVLPEGGIVELGLTRKREVKHFLNPAAGLALLRQMGVVRVEVRMEAWDLEQASLSMRMRPDVTARRVRAQHDEWVRLTRGSVAESGPVSRGAAREELRELRREEARGGVAEPEEELSLETARKMAQQLWEDARAERAAKGLD